MLVRLAVLGLVWFGSRKREEVKRSVWRREEVLDVRS